MGDMTGRERLIVPLDVPTTQEALDLVERLEPDVTFYKIGWQLFMTGDLRHLLERLRGRNVFVDLKLPGDIGNTIRSVIEACVRMDVRFLTLSDFVPKAAIASARAARGGGEWPKLLTVPYLSSLDASDLGRGAGADDLGRHILSRAAAALAAGCDGVIASGEAIGLLRQAHGAEVILVSPGIRPAGAPADDHKRHTTPAQAIELGADYLVVGRPIRSAKDPRTAARSIIDEIDRALERVSA